MPWNFPLAGLPLAAPALMAGNVGLRNTPRVPGCAERLNKYARCRLPPESSNSYIGSSKVEAIIRDPRESRNLTGSGPAGSNVAVIAGSKSKRSWSLAVIHLSS